MKRRGWQVMNKDTLTGKLLDRKEVAALPQTFPRQWFLLKIIDKDETGRAKLLNVVSFSESKDKLRELILESDPEDDRLIFYFADPDKECEI